MSKFIGKTVSNRHKIQFNSLPTKHSMRGSYDIYHDYRDYADILDCVYEMSDMISCSNGVSLERAIDQVLLDEQWTILPSHKKLIATMLQEK
jgi:hypothetical protein